MGDERGLLEWCTAGRPIPGEERSGDDALVLTDERRALVAAIDGVGHGAPASEAAEVAVAVLRQEPWDDVEALARRCHEALRPTRGAAVGLAAFGGEGTVTWLGVGNITGRLVTGGGLSSPPGGGLGSLSGVAGPEPGVLDRLAELYVELRPGGGPVRLDAAAVAEHAAG